MICSHCEIDKPSTEFASYFHSVQNKVRTRKVCKGCFNAQKKLYRESIKKEKISPQIEDMEEIEVSSPIVEPQPEPIVVEEPEEKPKETIMSKVRKLVDKLEGYDPNEGEEGYRKCNICERWKVKELNFYGSEKRGWQTYCIPCAKMYEKIRAQTRKEEEEANNFEQGSKEKVLRKPNTYVDDYQRDCTFEIMQALGWTFNEEKKIWWKIPIKDENGKWLVDKLTHARTLGKTLRKPKAKTSLAWSYTQDIQEQRKSGKTIKQLSIKYKTSTATIREILQID